MLKVKSSLRMLRVTWPVASKSKMTTYLEFPSPYCLFTIQLPGGYDDDERPFVGENFIHRHVFQGQNVDCACPVSRDLWQVGPKWPHIWNSRGHIVFMGLRRRSEAVYRWNYYTRAFLAQKFRSPFFSPIFDFGGIFQELDIIFHYQVFQKRLTYAETRVLSHKRSWSVFWCDL